MKVKNSGLASLPHLEPLEVPHESAPCGRRHLGAGSLRSRTSERSCAVPEGSMIESFYGVVVTATVLCYAVLGVSRRAAE